ncbi:GNAT family N-acetyltransferase [Methyloparacoccus murrellii]
MKFPDLHDVHCDGAKLLSNLPGLPLPPGPVGWIANRTHPWAEALRSQGFHLVNPQNEPLLSDSPISGKNEQLDWMYCDARCLGKYPINSLTRLRDNLKQDAILLLGWIGVLESHASEIPQESSLSLIEPMIDRSGWILTGSMSVSDSVRIWILSKADYLPRYEISMLDQWEFSPFKELFQRAFKAQVAEALWLWKYTQQRSACSIAKRGGRAVAHYGGIERRLRLLGRNVLGIQVCDVMVDPEEQGILTRNGAFTRSAKTFLECLTGYSGEYDVAFGFPNSRAFELGNKLGLYAEVDRLFEIRWEPLISYPRMLTTLRPFALAKENAQIIERLWQGMSDDLSNRVVGIRDLDYLHHRYAMHPAHCYSIFIMKNRIGGNPLGLLILRRDGETCRLIDWVGPLSRIPQMIDCVRRIAAGWNVSSVTAWVTQGCVDAFGSGDPVISPKDTVIPANIYIQKVSADSIRNRWWLMMGDTDFM